jgi:hypothetical protein
MTGMVILDVVIGLIFIFLLLSLFCTIVNEWIAQWTSLRAKTLKRGITELFGDERWKKIVDATDAKSILAQPASRALKQSLDQVRSFTEEFYRHPLIESLRKGASEPSYISSGTFARTVIDILRERATAAGIQLTGNEDLAQTFTKLTSQADQALKQAEAAKAVTPELAAQIRSVLDGTALTRVIETLAIDTAKEVDDIQRRLSAWFDEGMERVSGWYKRYLQYIGFSIGLVVAVIFNADAINMASVISREPVMRAALTQSATAAARDCTSPENCKAIDLVKSLQNKDRSLPLGWHDEYTPKMEFWPIVAWLLGLLLTALATTLGAPFWFDLLKKLVNIRTSGLVPEATRNR